MPVITGYYGNNLFLFHSFAQFNVNVEFIAFFFVFSL